MSPPVLHLPLDLSGMAATNRVVAELHPIAASGNRAVVTQRGPFYTRGLVVRNKNTGLTLVPDVDYRPVHMFLEASLRSTMEVCSVILVLPACSATAIEIDYQAVGGEYSASVSSIEQMVDSLDLDNRTVYWGDLIGAPEYFPPTAHLHDIGDLYGFEYVVAALEGVRRAILLGDQASFDEMRRYVDLQDNAIRALVNSGQSQIDDHINNRNNPHQTTKAHVGLGNVQDFAVATQAQAQAGTANNLYLTPLRGRELVMSVVGDTFNAHTANLDNPHQTTKAHVGLGLVVNRGIATLNQARAGSGDEYMTATLTGEAISTLTLGPLNAHINRVDNPHNTTKAQVGLGSVDNFATASNAQAIAGTATNLFMTPASSRAQINSMVGDAVSAHVNRVDNPHQTTKAQVGLGLVDNFATASDAQAAAGTAGNLFMTPASTRAAINSLAGGSIDVHIQRRDNPHAVTATQVGLGSVFNFGVASQADAENGTSHSTYMTPLRTAQLAQVRVINPLQEQINARVISGSNAQLNTLVIGNSGYLYQDGDGSISLRVAGSRYFQFQAGGNMVCHNGRMIAAGGFQPSDRNFKSGFKELEPRAFWRELNFLSYFDHYLDQEGRGITAQELQGIAPDRVTEFDYQNGEVSTKRLAVDYTGVAFEGMLAAGHEIDRLQHRVLELEEMVSQIQRQLIVVR